MMKLLINDREVEVADDCTLMQAMATYPLKTFNGIAIAVNNKVVPGNEWEDYLLRSEDKILIIQATQGG